MDHYIDKVGASLLEPIRSWDLFGQKAPDR